MIHGQFVKQGRLSSSRNRIGVGFSMSTISEKENLNENDHEMIMTRILIIINGHTKTRQFSATK